MQHHDCYVNFISWDHYYVLVQTAVDMHITLSRLRSGWLLKLNIISYAVTMLKLSVGFLINVQTLSNISVPIFL